MQVEFIEDEATGEYRIEAKSNDEKTFYCTVAYHAGSDSFKGHVIRKEETDIFLLMPWDHPNSDELTIDQNLANAVESSKSRLMQCIASYEETTVAPKDAMKRFFDQQRSRNRALGLE